MEAMGGSNGPISIDSVKKGISFKMEAGASWALIDREHSPYPKLLMGDR